MWARQNAQSGNPAVRKLAAQKRVEGCEAMLEQAKQDLERAGQRTRTATQEQPTTARVRLPDWMVHGCFFIYLVLIGLLYKATPMVASIDYKSC